MEDNRKRYEAICPICNETIYVCKNLGMEIGFINEGYGRCIKCNSSLLVKYDWEKDSMSLDKWRVEE